MQKPAPNGSGEEGGAAAPVEKPTCGIVMPISAIDGCSASHWVEVLGVLKDAAEAAGFAPKLVSNESAAGVIQDRIIRNLHSNPIVVCDVSAKNPNVMFELGMRLAFDKPAIIVKDDQTSYSFDMAPIEHVEYPRDLRYSGIVTFKEQLAATIKGTHEKATSDPTYTTFLKHFGDFKIAHLETKEVSGQEFITEKFTRLEATLQQLLARSSQNAARGRLIGRLSAVQEGDGLPAVLTRLGFIPGLVIEQEKDGKLNILLSNDFPSDRQDVVWEVFDELREEGIDVGLLQSQNKIY